MARLPALLLAIVLVLPAAGAYPDPDKAPRYYDSGCFATYDRRFVHDYVGAMHPDLATETEGAACDVYKATGAHFVFAAVQSTDGEPLEPYALHLFERWGIGDAKRLDGLLLLYVQDYARDGAKSAVRIEVGYGLTGVVNGIVAADVVGAMQDAKRRAVDAGESDADATSYALALGSLVLLRLVMDNYENGQFPAPERASLAEAVPWWVWVVAILLVFALISALARSGRGRRGWGYYPGSPHWSSGMGSIFASQMMRGGGGFGGGGGGFGGGRSGGGGGSGGL